MKLELEALEMNHAWELVPKSQAFSTMSCKWMFKVKLKVFDGHGGKVAALFVRDHLPRVIVEDGDFPSELEKVVTRSFTPKCIMHPDTYLNKVILGSEQGSLQLWNVISTKKLYDFSHWQSPIHCSVSSPALDVVAIGCADGKIYVRNIHYDEEIVSFTRCPRCSHSLIIQYRCTTTFSIRRFLWHY